MSHYKVHRVRFVPYIPQAIHCLAVEKTINPRLAVSRADNSIELWNIGENWFMERKIHGCNNASVEALVWSGSRLFSSGLHGEITEWDINKLCIKKSVDSYGGAVWCLGVNGEDSLLAAGCEDGCVRLFNITNDELEFARIFTKQEGRILSLCWHKDGQILVAGGSDGTIRVYEVSTGHARLRITLDNISKKDTLVWSLIVTSDLTIISGDSLGKTQFWDGKYGTLIKSFNVHIADVLAICINKREDTVYSSGVDNKLMQFKLVNNKEGKKFWARSNSTRAHTHDIRALAWLRKKKGKNTEDILVSGGVDTSLIIYSTKLFGRSSIRKIPAFGQFADIHLATKAEIIVYQKPSSLHFWKLGKTVNDECVRLEENPSHLLQIDVKGSNHIICSAVSNDCIWTAFSDINHISIFKLELGSPTTDVQMIKSLPENLLPALRMKFTPDNTKLVTVSNEKSLQIIDFVSHPITAETIAFPVLATEVGEKYIDSCSPITSLVVSEDGKFCACSDAACCINVFDISKAKHRCTLPRLSRQTTAMAFQPGTNILTLVTTKKELFMFDINQMKMTEWSKQASENGLPRQWQTQPAKVIRILFDRHSPNIMLLHSMDMIALLDIAKPLPQNGIKLFETKQERFGEKSRKRKHEVVTETKQTEDVRETVEQPGSFRVCRKYKPLLFLGLNEDNSLVTVERSWLSILDSLPPTLHRKRYGT